MTDTPQILLAHHLKALKLPTFLREYDKVARQCAAEGVDHPRYLMRLAEMEMIDRERRMVERRIKAARFPTVKSLDSFDFLALPSLNKMLVLELARSDYVERRENIIAVGNSGTGKSHIALGLGLAACQKGLSVGFITASALVHELLEARDEKRLLRLQRQLSGYKLLIIDELGYVPLSTTGAELLFEIFSQRYERGSTLVTSNLPFDEWTSVFGSERLTGALLDRLTHHVHILEMNGDSFRLAHSKRRSRRARSEPPSDAPLRNEPPQARRPPISGAFLLASVLHFYSGNPLQYLSGVDSFGSPTERSPSGLVQSTAVQTIARETRRANPCVRATARSSRRAGAEFRSCERFKHWDIRLPLVGARCRRRRGVVVVVVVPDQENPDEKDACHDGDGGPGLDLVVALRLLDPGRSARSKRRLVGRRRNGLHRLRTHGAGGRACGPCAGAHIPKHQRARNQNRHEPTRHGGFL